MSEKLMLSPNFSFDELTVTSNEKLQAANREAAMAYLPSLKALALLLEWARDGKPLKVNSAFRSAALNKATVGSSPTSQHPMGQAADISRPGSSSNALFEDLRARLRADKRAFGQLIHESARRDYGDVFWVHISLGANFWKPERCGEVLTKHDDPKTGKAVFTPVEKIPQEAI